MPKDVKRPCELCSGTTRLEIDHVNGNHADNSRGNLMTLCSFCHMTKTRIGNATFAILIQLAKDSKRIKLMIRSSSAEWMGRNTDVKSYHETKSYQMNLFDSMEKLQYPSHDLMDIEEVEELVLVL